VQIINSTDHKDSRRVGLSTPLLTCPSL